MSYRIRVIHINNKINGLKTYYKPETKKGNNSEWVGLNILQYTVCTNGKINKQIMDVNISYVDDNYMTEDKNKAIEVLQFFKNKNTIEFDDEFIYI
jgi:hypothetical protein